MPHTADVKNGKAVFGTLGAMRDVLRMQSRGNNATGGRGRPPLRKRAGDERTKVYAAVWEATGGRGRRPLRKRAGFVRTRMQAAVWEATGGRGRPPLRTRAGDGANKGARGKGIGAIFRRTLRSPFLPKTAVFGTTSSWGFLRGFLSRRPLKRLSRILP